MSSHDCEPLSELTFTCNGVEKAFSDIESYIFLHTNAAQDSVSPALLVVFEDRQLRYKKLGFGN